MAKVGYPEILYGRKCSLLNRLFKRLWHPIEPELPTDDEDSRSTQNLDDMKFNDIVVFYNLVFDLGNDINPTKAARILLREDIAVAATNYQTGEPELAERDRKLKRLHNQAQMLAQLDDLLREQGVGSVARFLLKKPRIMIWMVQARFWGSTEAAEHDEDDRELKDILASATTSIEESIATVQLWEKLRFESDKRLFSPTYLVQVPFTRITLQPFEATIYGQNNTVDVEVLLHRSGVAVLRFAVVFTETMSTDQAIDIQFASNVHVTTWKVARQLVEVQTRAAGITSKELSAAPFEHEFSGGIEWLENVDAEDFTLTDLLRHYQEAILSIVFDKSHKGRHRLRNPDWFSYPVTFVRRSTPQPTISSLFKESHERVLAGLAWRLPNWRILNDEFVKEATESDNSHSDDESFYIGSGSSTVIYHGAHIHELESKFGNDIPGQEWIWSHLNRSTLIDMLLVQLWILRTIRSELTVLPYNLKKLNAVRRAFVFALEEYHAAMFAYGTANDIVKRGQKTLGIDEEYGRVMAHMSNLENLIAAEESHARQRRDELLRITTTVATVLLGLPGAYQFASVLAAWETFESNRLPDWLVRFVNDILDFADNHPTQLTLSIYIFLMVIILPVAFLGVFNKRSSRPIASMDGSRVAGRPGFTWPSNVSIVVHDDKNNHDNIANS